MTRRRTSIAVVTLVLSLVAALPAWAALILQPTGASTNMGTAFGSPTNTINQSGLSAGYTSLVTDFDTYLAGPPTHDSSGTSNLWQSVSGAPTGNFDFVLGGPFTIESFALWNIGSGNSTNVVNFTLLAADNAFFNNATTLGSFTADTSSTFTAVEPDVFTFTPTEASFVRMQITSNLGNTFTGFGEAAFAVTPVPLPAAAWLFGSGLIGLAALARRRMSS